jgi:hypothetical protein
MTLSKDWSKGRGECPLRAPPRSLQVTSAGISRASDFLTQLFARPEAGGPLKLTTSTSSSITTLFSRSIARCSKFFDNLRRAPFNCCGQVLAANSAQRAACLRYSLGFDVTPQPIRNL